MQGPHIFSCFQILISETVVVRGVEGRGLWFLFSMLNGSTTAKPKYTRWLWSLAHNTQTRSIACVLPHRLIGWITSKRATTPPISLAILPQDLLLTKRGRQSLATSISTTLSINLRTRTTHLLALLLLLAATRPRPQLPLSTPSLPAPLRTYLFYFFFIFSALGGIFYLHEACVQGWRHWLHHLNAEFIPDFF